MPQFYISEGGGRLLFHPFLANFLIVYDQGNNKSRRFVERISTTGHVNFNTYQGFSNKLRLSR